MPREQLPSNESSDSYSIATGVGERMNIPREDVITGVGAILEKKPEFKDAPPRHRLLIAKTAIRDYLRDVSHNKYSSFDENKVTEDAIAIIELAGYGLHG